MKIDKLVFCIVGNFFLWVSLSRILSLFGISFNLFRVFQISGVLIAFYYLLKIKKNGFDLLIMLYLTYILVNMIMIDYNYHGEMSYYAFIAQIIPVFFYYIGRGNVSLSMQEVIKRMKWPILISIVCGLFFFVQPPNWYMQMKLDQTNEVTNDYSMLEIFRLSSFWGHPYQVGYATLLYFSYLMYDSIKNGIGKEKKGIRIASMLLCIICLILAQLRVTIAVALLLLFYFIFLEKRDNKVSLFLSIFFAVIIVIGISLYFINSNSDLSNYIYEHTAMIFNQEDYTNRFEHTAGGITNYSLFGDGFGRYGFLAREHNGWALVDHEFQRHLAELGYVGCGFLIIILSLTFRYCFLNKDLALETGVFLFFVISMIGASVLSNEHQYNFIFWFCIGRIWNTIYNKERVKNVH